MFRRLNPCVALVAATIAGSCLAGPAIDPIPNASIPAGKSITIPITATSTNGRTLVYTVTSSTNRITVELHTNNPFWKMSVVQVAPSNAPGAYLTPFRGGLAMVTNIGDMTFLLFRDRAPRTVDAIQGLTMAGFYNSNTIFHRVIPGFVIQGGDPSTNGNGGPVFRYDDEFHTRALFAGHGQLALANSGKDTDGSQFFITQGAQRALDLGYTLFGQLLRGFNVLTNVINTPRATTNNRPFADVIITRASFVTNYTDTVITLTGTNLPGVSGTIKVIADDGTVGGRTTNSFTATTVSDAANNAPPILFPATGSNQVGAVNARLTNFVAAFDFETNAYYWYPLAYDYNATNSQFSVVNDRLKMVVVPVTNFIGTARYLIVVSPDPNWLLYYQNLPQNQWPAYDWQPFAFTFGDTRITAQPTAFVAQQSTAFNKIVATFTNGVPSASDTNFTAQINWGDDTTNSGVVLTTTGPSRNVYGSHTYTNAGNYPIYVTIRSYLGAEATVVSTAIVPPAISITKSGTNTVLNWPAWATEYSAQSHTNLATTNWVTQTNLPALIGYNSVLTNAANSSNAFYRLKR